MNSAEIKKRLNRAMGQLSKVGKMIEGDDDPKKVLQQLVAARSAIKAIHCIYIAQELSVDAERGAALDDMSFLIKNLGKL